MLGYGYHQGQLGPAVDLTGSLSALALSGGFLQHCHPQVQSQAGLFFEALQSSDLASQFAAADGSKAGNGADSLGHCRLPGGGDAQVAQAINLLLKTLRELDPVEDTT